MKPLCHCYYRHARTCEHVNPPRKWSERIAKRHASRGYTEERRNDRSVVGWHAWTSQGEDYYAFCCRSEHLRDGRPRRFRK